MLIEMLRTYPFEALLLATRFVPGILQNFVAPLVNKIMIIGLNLGRLSRVFLYPTSRNWEMRCFHPKMIGVRIDCPE